MCGIVGTANLDGTPVDETDVAAANALLAHRGPDGEGLFLHENVCLAHRRLAIIDPRLGRQPFLSEDGQLALTYNGEIYNYVELRAELPPETRFATQSDTEVVLKSYQRWGMECLQRFRGMFAFALYDASNRRLFLVRDRVGIKPLYYCQSGRRFAFASELAALLAFPWLERKIDTASVAQYFRYAYVPTPATIYRGIHRLEPGCYLSIDTATGAISMHRYWDLAVAVAAGEEEARLERLNALLDDTIRLYVRSDVPFGSFLSGGVDSSLVTALMTRTLRDPVRTYSIGFRESPHSELGFAAEASRTVGTVHHERLLTPDLALQTLGRLAWHFGEPFGDSSSIPTYYVSREAAQHVKMVLSGDGGDELFGGYDSYRTAFADLSDPLYPAKRIVAGALRRMPVGDRLRTRLRRRAIGLLELQDSQRFIFDRNALQALLVAPDIPSPVRHRSAMGADADVIAVLQAEDFKGYLPDDVLTKVDRMSMANSLEVRVPLLDHEIVEFAFALPLSLRLRGVRRGDRIETKHLLKRSAARFYPRQFLSRPKQGFGIPIVEWCVGPLRGLIVQRLTARRSALFDWVRREEVARLVAPLAAGRAEHVAKLWSLLMFDLWLTEVHQRPR
jgi:asparagine synthase (glutamine-hydrolysing)